MHVFPLKFSAVLASFCAIAWILIFSGQARAFIPADRWIDTASGFAGYRGDPITLTWSLVPDGTLIPYWQPSGLIATLDAYYGAGSGGEDLTGRPWFPLIESAFDRWSELGGVTFVYEPRDDGAVHRNSAGELGVRGDVRLAGTEVDGSGGQLAFSQYPDTGDIVLDTKDTGRFTNPASNYLWLRNTLMHEIGHALGFDHIISSDANFLMEPVLNLLFDGPQMDDIRGLHYLYGDRLEWNRDGIGNNTPSQAVALGPLALGDMISLGQDAGPDLVVDASDVDFLSIHKRTDLDYFSFEVVQPAWIDLALMPRGGSFFQAAAGEQELLYNANTANDLLLAIYDADTSLLARVDDLPRGGVETFENFYLPSAGRYFIRVWGSHEAVQLYELSIAVHGDPVPEPSVILLTWPMILFGVVWRIHRRLV
ncbi:MAG: matrixin family metalloprotease [Pirellulales bacterium]|nr:matrixin family metalloprotease [Pirellulales bacterium]